MNSNAPISPPVTPKGYKHNDIHVEESWLLLPPPANHNLMCRKSNVRRFCRSMATMIDNKKKKPIPKKSPSPFTKGSFTMDLFKDVLSTLSGVKDGIKSSRKKRNNTHLEEEEMTEFSVSVAQSQSNERHIHKKSKKSDAIVTFDSMDVTIQDNQVFKDDPKWIPNMSALDEKPNIKVSWKGSPLFIKNLPFVNLLHPSEINIASTLRLTPEQYLKCKRTLIMAAKEFHKTHTHFRKSDAQKCIRIDVNKTSVLWSVFNQLGWFTPS